VAVLTVVSLRAACCWGVVGVREEAEGVAERSWDAGATAAGATEESAERVFAGGAETFAPATRGRDEAASAMMGAETEDAEATAGAVDRVVTASGREGSVGKAGLAPEGIWARVGVAEEDWATVGRTRPLFDPAEAIPAGSDAAGLETTGATRGAAVTAEASRTAEGVVISAVTVPETAEEAVTGTGSWATGIAAAVTPATGTETGTASLATGGRTRPLLEAMAPPEVSGVAGLGAVGRWSPGRAEAEATDAARTPAVAAATADWAAVLAEAAVAATLAAVCAETAAVCAATLTAATRAAVWAAVWATFTAEVTAAVCAIP
jgi:hypothetical protein